MSKRRHRMPFGAEVTDDGVRFRLWAPAAKRVDLKLGAAGTLRMASAGDGFFELTTPAASAGARYGYVIDGGDLVVPDPVSRSNPDDVHLPSQVVDPLTFEWADDEWAGRPWAEAVIYELHVGSFTAAGTFTGVIEHLPYLSSLGVTAIELMPVAEFAGRRGWGYDGVLPFAPESAYGGPEPLKRLVQTAHAQGLMVLLDVVYNHFGPEGNYLHLYAPQFFTDRVHTPWGQAIDFEGPARDNVREFFIHNALYWLEEFNFDGLRIDAVHAIYDRSRPDILEELAARVHAAVPSGRHVHLVLENDRNEAHYLRATEDRGTPFYRAQWNDDFHHAAHVLLTGERHGYYMDYVDDPVDLLGRALAEGFSYQGENSRYRRARRGEPSADLPTSAFVNFLQNHDQTGNRALGERLGELSGLDALAVAQTLLLLSPQPPMLFMGEEFDASSRFPYFCDFPPELGTAVATGRRNQFKQFADFESAAARRQIPDPNAAATAESARLDWSEREHAANAAVLAHYRELLSLRKRWLVPRLPATRGRAARPQGALEVSWDLASSGRWRLIANLGGRPITVAQPAGRCVYLENAADSDGGALTFESWSVAVFLEDTADG